MARRTHRMRHEKEHMEYVGDWRSGKIHTRIHECKGKSMYMLTFSNNIFLRQKIREHTRHVRKKKKKKKGNTYSSSSSPDSLSLPNRAFSSFFSASGFGFSSSSLSEPSSRSLAAWLFSALSEAASLSEFSPSDTLRLFLATEGPREEVTYQSEQTDKTTKQIWLKAKPEEEDKHGEKEQQVEMQKKNWIKGHSGKLAFLIVIILAVWENGLLPLHWNYSKKCTEFNVLSYISLIVSVTL